MTTDIPRWVKSTWSLSNGNCVEVANLPGGEVGVRDSKNCTGPVLSFEPRQWQSFLTTLGDGKELPARREPLVVRYAPSHVAGVVPVADPALVVLLM
jgi:hypothetical protein